MATAKAPEKAPRKVAVPSVSKVPVITEGDALDQLQIQLTQAAAENEALQNRIKQLAGFQQEVQSSRQSIVDLTAKLSSAIQDKDAAVRAASAARNDATNASVAASVDAEKVGHADALAKAIKGLIGK